MIGDDKNYHLLVIIIHVLIEFGIKLTFEWPQCVNFSESFQMIFRALVSSCSGILVYLNIHRGEAAMQAKDNNYKNTFFPFTIHILICIFEHIAVVFIPTEEAKSQSFIIAPFVLLTVAVFLQILYYKFYHPASILNTNGPRFCPTDSICCSCATLCCCHMQDCVIPRGYQKVPEKSMQNGHANHEMAEIYQDTSDIMV